MRAEQIRYGVPGWGVGELWVADGVLLAHDFDFGAGSGAGALGAGADEVVPVSGRSRTEPRAALLSAAPLSAAPLSAAPLEGVHGPPTGTVPATSAQVGNGFVSDRQQHETGQSLDPDEITGWSLNPQDLVGSFARFLAGESVSFGDVQLDLSWATPFQHALAGALRAVPRGEIVSYRELALLAGHPGAHRAAGTFCARNRFAFVLPCHRVVGADGIGGYGSAGIAVKRRLLALEGVEL